MSETIIFYIENTIPGILYISASFFFYLSFIGVYELSWIEKISKYLPYIFIGILAISSIIGYSFQKIMEKIIYKIIPRHEYDPQKEIQIFKLENDQIKKRLHHFYVVLVLFRHLVVGTSLLLVSLVIWLYGAKNFDVLLNTTIIFLLLITLFTITYILHRRTFIRLKEKIE